MIIVQDRPPNFEEIVRAFPQAAKQRGVVYAWGETLYNPDGIEVPPPLKAHEEVHQVRQVALEGGPAAWWARYLAEREFCFAEELLAHQAEYRRFCDEYKSNARGRAQFLAFVARRLCGPLYGHPVTFEKAKHLIRWGGQ